jgi:hypothetical protein
MDYKKVYARFIESRKSMVHDGYFEVHHIVPKAFGGSNEPDNLIKLTPSDHFFAHVLLAKIYGGPMWPAVFLMSNRRWNGRPQKSFRLAYEISRREWAKYAATIPGKKGKENASYIHERYEWLNLDTLETLHATPGEMHASLGGTRAMWTQVLSGHKNSAYGWILATETHKTRGFKGKKFKFFNENGRVFEGTQQDFVSFSGVSIATASRICKHGVVSKNGWGLENSQKPLPGRQNSGAFYKIFKNKEQEKVMQRIEAAKFFNVSPSCFSSGAYYAEKNGKPYKGWYVKKIA